MASGKMTVMKQRYTIGGFGWRQLLTISLLCLPFLAEPAMASSPQSLQNLLKYLQQDIFLTPGVGLKKVRIGQPISQVIKAWGPPQQRKNSGFLGRKQQWLYQGLGNTDIIVTSLNNRVNRLSFRAHLVSPYQTINGLQFGMVSVQVRSLLGVGQAGNNGQLLYPDKGLTIEFKEGRGQNITIFKPGA